MTCKATYVATDVFSCVACNSNKLTSSDGSRALYNTGNIKSCGVDGYTNKVTSIVCNTNYYALTGAATSSASATYNSADATTVVCYITIFVSVKGILLGVWMFY